LMQYPMGLVRVCPDRTGHGSTCRVDWVLPGYCLDRYFIKPEPIQPPDRPGSGSPVGLDQV
jgi:hypothetical protein